MNKEENINLLTQSLEHSYFDKSQYAQSSEAIDLVKYLFSKGYEQQDILYLISKMVVSAKNQLPTTIPISENAKAKNKPISHSPVKILESSCTWFPNF